MSAGPWFIRALYRPDGHSFLLGDVYPTKDAAVQALVRMGIANSEKFGYMNCVIEASEATPEEVALSLRSVVKQILYPEFHEYWTKRGVGHDPIADIVHAAVSGRVPAEAAITQLHELARQPDHLMHYPDAA